MSERIKRKTTTNRRRNHPYNKKRASGSDRRFWIRNLFAKTYFGKVIIGIVIAIVIILINLLITKNRFELFFLLLGIEIIVAAVGGWLIYLLRQDADK